jgi:hypothetical protein
MDPEPGKPDSLFDRLPPDIQAEALARRQREEDEAVQYRQRRRRWRAVSTGLGAAAALGIGILLVPSLWFLPLLATAGGAAAFAIEAFECGHLGGIGLYGVSGIVLTGFGSFAGAVHNNALVLFSCWLFYLVAGALLGLRSMRGPGR